MDICDLGRVYLSHLTATTVNVCTAKIRSLPIVVTPALPNRRPIPASEITPVPCGRHDISADYPCSARAPLDILTVDQVQRVPSSSFRTNLVFSRGTLPLSRLSTTHADHQTILAPVKKTCQLTIRLLKYNNSGRVFIVECSILSYSIK